MTPNSQVNGEDRQPSRSAGADTTITFGSPEAAEESRSALGLAADEVALVQALPAGAAILIAQRGPGVGSRFLLDTDVVEAGRAESADIFLDDATVSRKHALFEQEGGAFTVSDVGSLNGTYVNRERIESVRLYDGDEVQIGKFRLSFYSSPASGPGSDAHDSVTA